MCRAAYEGLLSPELDTDYFRVWMVSMLVAFFQLVGGLATVAPSNLPEVSVFFLSHRPWWHVCYPPHPISFGDTW